MKSNIHMDQPAPSSVVISESFRVFVSYCNDDQMLADIVIRTLGKAQHGLGFDVRDMSHLSAGVNFALELRDWISRSHALVVIVTPHSISRPWINQEVGYALAHCIPVYAVMSGVSYGPAGMLEGLQAIEIDDSIDWTVQLKAKLGEVQWDQRQRARGSRCWPVFACHRDAAMRTRLLEESAEIVAAEFGQARIRQRSRLTSFSIPPTLIHRSWSRFRGPLLERLAFWLCPGERKAFEMLCAGARCDLIICPDSFGKDYDRDVQCARLETLADFLKAKRDDAVRVVVEDQSEGDSVTIIGNHWVALSACVATAFYHERDTFSTWHAPTVDEYCTAFDEVFDRLLQDQESKHAGCSSRQYAITRIMEALSTRGGSSHTAL